MRLSYRICKTLMHYYDCCSGSPSSSSVSKDRCHEEEGRVTMGRTSTRHSSLGREEGGEGEAERRSRTDNATAVIHQIWQQGPASFNITAETDVCTLPINVPKLIIVYVTYYCLKLSDISTLMATGCGQHGKHRSLSTAELCARHNYRKIPFSHINYYLQFVNVKLL